MKILLIGGTGNISSAVTNMLYQGGHEVWLLNRGNKRHEIPAGIRQIVADINDEAATDQMLGNQQFDAVCQFIGFQPEQVERDIRLFRHRTRQYVFISSASVYLKPAPHYLLTEQTPVGNPFSAYARGKIACEEVLMKACRDQHFPVTIVRPSHTYGSQMIPVSVRGPKGFWQVVRRMLDGRPVIIQGDGSSLWTMTWNEDFAQGGVGLLGNAQAIGETFHITSDETLTWNQIYQAIAEGLGVELKCCHIASETLCAEAPQEWGFEANLLGDKSVSVVFDCTKLRRLVPSFLPSTPFSQGVRRSISYVLSHPELQVADPEFDAWCDRLIEQHSSRHYTINSYGKKGV